MAELIILRERATRNGRISADEVRALLHYDPVTGIFRWKVRETVKRNWNTRYAGKVAGAHRNGKSRHIQIVIHKRIYLAHRLAWLYVTGEWPTSQIDHKDTNQSNNKWLNLRKASQPQNMMNRGKNKNNKSGFKGVYKETHTGLWVARITANRHIYILGRYSSPEMAHAAYRAAATRLHGEFARTK